tara:strand:- start:129 stop:317 length:189 start_codon:yes stop_codon:yes gene_type:complete
MKYETNRDNFEKIIRDYLAYLKLYKMVNNGSAEGVSKFEDFYWQNNYYVRYEDPSRIAAVGN